MSRYNPYNLSRLTILARNAIDRFQGLFKPTLPTFSNASLGSRFADRKFLLLRRDVGFMSAGLFYYVIPFIECCRYAEEEGFTPVVDMQNTPCQYLEDHEVGKVNAWEFYFKQPAGFSLADCADAASVTTCRTQNLHLPKERHILAPYDPDATDEKLSFWRAQARRYVQPNDIANEEIEKEAKSVFGETGPDDSLGVFLRGTDYAKLHPTGHMVQPEPEDVINDAKAMLREFGLKRLFLVTEDLGIIRMFRGAFGDRLLVKSQNLVEYRGGYIAENRPAILRDRERYRRGLDYLVNVFLLARCRFVLASCACGSVAAGLLAREDQVARYYNLGFYSRFGRLEKRQK